MSDKLEGFGLKDFHTGCSPTIILSWSCHGYVDFVDSCFNNLFYEKRGGRKGDQESPPLHPTLWFSFLIPNFLVVVLSNLKVH